MPTITKKTSFSTLWEKYGLTKPTNSEAVATLATQAFTSFTDVKRSPNQVVVVKVQEGVDPLWNNLISTGMELVATSFAYPSFNGPVYALAGLDSAWMVKTFVSVGFSQQFAESRVRNFNDSVANAGGNTAIWNITNLNKKDSLVTNKIGTYQTPGHEFFHPIQQQLFKGGPKFPADGSGGPQWFLEGSAVFVGVQTSSKLGLISYESEGRPYLTKNVLSDAATRNGKLEDAKTNLNRAGDIFPYNLGALGVEFLVANVGIQNMVDVFSQMGQGKSFSVAFEAATGIELVDFYAMFEEARPALGFAIGSTVPVVPAPAPSPAPAPTPSVAPTPSTEQAKLTLEEVKKHASATDCWAVVDRGVYDLTKWIALHPGGTSYIRALCGRDATSDFLGRHANQADPARALSNYFLGKLDQ
jgi:cytochrome b involved in lipid metabolism